LWNLNVGMKTFVVYQATKKRLDAIKSTVKEHYRIQAMTEIRKKYKTYFRLTNFHNTLIK